MESILNNRPALAAEVDKVAEVAGYLWQKGWAERNGGNITINVTEYVDDAIKAMPAISEVKPIGTVLPHLKGCYFYCKGTQKRMRDLARRPMENGSIIRILDDCASYVIIADSPVMPTSELPSHLSVHNYLISKGLPYKASVHTHPIELVAMSHNKKFLEKDVASNLLWSMIPETKAFCPRGLGIIPYKLPSSVELAEATIRELDDYDVVMWEKHGVFAVDVDVMSAFDQVDVLNKSALIYIAAKNMGFEPDGMSQLNETSYFGAGCRENIAVEAARRGFKKAFFVTDKDLIRFHVADKVIEVFEKNNIPYELFSDVKANPTIANVQHGVEAFKASGADFIVALGGGSSIDTAKGIGIVVNNPDFADVKSLEGVADTRQKAVPTFALPTTAGTAAEVTINYVIIDEDAKKKMVCVDPNDIPSVAIVDPELMYSMPKGLTAATGMDALTHAIESFITPGAWVMSDMFELKAIEMIAANLKAAVDNGNDTVAREAMSQAQYIAGMGFSNVGLGIVHSMAHPLGAHYDTPHGVANALLLPYVMEYNANSPAAPKYLQIAKAMGVNTEGMSEAEGVRAAIDAVRQLSLSIGIPQKLHEIGVREEDLHQLSIDAFNDVCTGGNPRPTSVEDIEALYRQAY